MVGICVNSVVVCFLCILHVNFVISGCGFVVMAL